MRWYRQNDQPIKLTSIVKGDPKDPFSIVLYLAYSSKERTNTGWKFLNNYINKREKQEESTIQIYNVQ